MAIYGSDQHVSDESSVAVFGPPDAETTWIKDMAEQAAFFVEDGKYLRMDFCEEHFFQCHDEETGEEYLIEYTEVDTETSKFMKLEPVVSPTLPLPKLSTELLSLCQRSLLALDEDDFPELRNQLRMAVAKAEVQTNG